LWVLNDKLLAVCFVNLVLAQQLAKFPKPSK
jgi:hypothetical protein